MSSFRRTLVVTISASALGCHEAAPPPVDVARTEPGYYADAMFLAKERAADCARPGMPEGRGRVDVDLDPEGRVTAATLAIAPFKDTPVGDCVLEAAKSMRLPPSHEQSKTQLRVIVGRDSGSWLHPGELDQFAIDEQTRSAIRVIQRDCMKHLEPDLHAKLFFDRTTGHVVRTEIESDRLGGVRPCIDEKLRQISVAPFEGDETVRVTLSPKHDPWHFRLRY